MDTPKLKLVTVGLQKIVRKADKGTIKRFLSVPILLFAFTSCEVSFNKDHLKEGHELMEKGEFFKALLEFDDVLFLDPGNLEAHRGKVRSYLGMNNLAKALESANKYIELSPESAIGYSDRGTIYLRMEDYENALADFSRSTTMDTTATKVASYNTAQALNALRRYKEAIRYYSIVIEANQQDGQALFQRAQCKMQLKDTTGTCEDLSAALNTGHEKAKWLAQLVCTNRN